MSARSLAEDKTAPPPGPVPFEQIPDLLEKPDAKVKAGIDGLIAAVAAEVKANRLPPALSERLRVEAERETIPSNIDDKEFFGAVHLPSDNDAVAKAAIVLKEAFVTAKHDCAADYELVRDAISARLVELTRHAKTPEEVDSARAIVVRIRKWFESHRAAIGAPLKVNGTFGPFNAIGCETYLRCFSVILADIKKSPTEISEHDVSSFLNARNPVSDADFRVRFLLMREPLKDAVEASEDALAKALLERKSSADVSSALHAYEDAWKRYKRMDFGSVHSASIDDGLREGARQYQALAEAASAVEARQWSDAWQRMGGALQAIQHMNSKRWLAFQQLIGKWDEELKRGLSGASQTNEAKPEARAIDEGFRAKLAEVKNPDDLQSLAAALPELKTKEASAEAQRFSNAISDLAALWRSRDPREILERSMRSDPDQGAPFAADVKRLRERIALESLARIWGAPELSKPPLALLPLEDALDHLCSDLGSRGEWERLFRILETRYAAVAQTGAIPKGADAISSVRAFLAGSNFELAEQWTDAAALYMTVLRDAVKDTPIREAAVRLKALAKEHPKEVEAARAPALKRALPPYR